MASKASIKIGDRFETKYGPCEVIDYQGCDKVYVKFDNTGGITKTNSTDLRRDQVKDWYYPTVENKGWFGQGKYKARINNKITSEYQIWQGMLKRCYNEIILQKEPSYRGCEVCKEWLDFQIFGDWMNSIDYRKEGWQLDKDLLFKNNKIYCPEKCCFIPSRLNKALAVNKITNKTLPMGVTLNKGKYTASMNINGINTYLGIYSTPEEASKIYKEKRLEYLYSIANEEDCPKFIINKLESFVYD